MSIWPRSLIGWSTWALATATAVSATGWEKEAGFDATVHDHEFHKIVIEQQGGSCVVAFKVSFRAPKTAYEHPEAGRNYYRFKARVELNEGKTVLSPQFANRAPGNRVFRWTEDTTGDGCWGSQLHKLQNVDVEGCRNRNCKVQPFE